MHLKRTLLFAFVSISLWAQAPAADPKKVVATVAGKDITAADIQKMTAMFSPQDLQAFQQNPQFILSQYFLFVHLAEEGEKRNLLDKSPYKEQYEGLKLQLLRNARVNDENNTFPVSPEMIDAYYKAAQRPIRTGQDQGDLHSLRRPGGSHRHRYGRAGSRRKSAGNRAIQTAGSGSPHAGRRYREAASRRRGFRQAGGTVFGRRRLPRPRAAISASSRPASDYPAELKTAVFALKPGEISEPIRQPTAFYIVRLEEKGPQPVAEIRETIVTALRNEHMNQWMKEMNASHQAVIKDPDFFKAPGAPALPGGFSVAPPKN